MSLDDDDEHYSSEDGNAEVDDQAGERAHHQALQCDFEGLGEETDDEHDNANEGHEDGHVDFSNVE